jgi:hypothetical protein
VSIPGRGQRAAIGRLVPARASYEDYRAARERFFERLRVDSEIRRLEKAWRLPAARDRGRPPAA